MKQIAAALVKAQRGFSPALKTSSNPHFRSKYADLSACVEAVIDSLNANGIFLMQPTHRTEDGVTVETLFIHESGETISAGKLHVPASKQDAQGYGSALTYARRYSLMAACGIAPEDDDGNAASKPRKSEPKREAETPVIKATDGAGDAIDADTRAELDELAAYLVECHQAGKDMDAIQCWYGTDLENDHRVYLWQQLGPYSKLRSAIKSNKPAKEAA